MKPSPKRILLPLLALLLVATVTVEAQADRQSKKDGAPARAGQRPRDQTPSWLMPPVQGPNLHYKTFDSKTVGQKVSYLLYLPPDYETAKERRYPVVYWLHGIGGSQQGVPGMTARLTSAIEAGKTPPFLMVFVNGMIRSSYVDSADGKTPVETVTIKELIPHVDATHRTIAAREGRMIEGFSMGGSGAAKWGFKHTDLFGSISIVDGALHSSNDATSGKMAETLKNIYGGDKERFAASDPWKLAEKNADKVKDRTAIRIVTGSRMLTGTNTKFHELLDRLKLAHEFDVIPDAPHSPVPLYEGLGDKNWAFYRCALDQVAIASSRGNSAPAAKPAALVTTQAAGTPRGFLLNGEHWTYRDGAFEMTGILLKPEGKGPFPAVLISHGLGGSAESFGMNKAGEFVKWGMVCIAPNYTHNVRAAGRRPGPPNTGQTNYGASEENLRRAATCIELLRAVPGVDPQRITAYGHSMGGFVTIGLAATAPDLLKAAAITGSGVAPRTGFPAPSVELASKIRTPFLILHGGSDPVVRPEQSALLKESLDRNRVPNERRLFDNEGHPIDQSKRQEVFALIREWFATHGLLTPK